MVAGDVNAYNMDVHCGRVSGGPSPSTGLRVVGHDGVQPGISSVSGQPAHSHAMAASPHGSDSAMPLDGLPVTHSGELRCSPIQSVDQVRRTVCTALRSLLLRGSVPHALQDQCLGVESHHRDGTLSRGSDTSRHWPRRAVASAQTTGPARSFQPEPSEPDFQSFQPRYSRCVATRIMLLESGRIRSQPMD